MGAARALSRVPLVLALIVLGILVLQRAPFQLDDAFITYRYARNLVEHGTLAFNLGDPPVEGFSSPLWMLLLAGCAALFGASALPHCATALGVLAAAASLVLMQRLTRRDQALAGEPTSLARIAAEGAQVMWLALMPAFIRYVSTGLEHPLFLVCVLGVAATCAGRLPLRAGACFAALAPWVRPEGPWLVVACAAQRWAGGAGGLRACVRDRVIGALALAAGGGQLVLSIVRWLVFEDVVPNTYWAKASHLDTGGIRYLGTVFGTGWGLAIAAGALLGVLRGTREHRGYAAAGAAWLVATCLEGGDWMADGRLALPGLALLVAASAGALSDLSGAVSAPRRLATVASALLVASGIGSSAAQAHETVRLDRANFRSLAHEQRVLSQWLIAAQARSVALVDIGEIGFMGDQQLTDLVGLTDRRIARSSGRHMLKDFDLGYVFDTRRPDVIVLRLWEAPTPALMDGAPGAKPAVMGGIEERLALDPRLARDYRLLFAQLPERRLNPYYGRLVYARTSFEPAIAIPERMTYIEELPD